MVEEGWRRQRKGDRRDQVGRWRRVQVSPGGSAEMAVTRNLSAPTPQPSMCTSLSLSVLEKPSVCAEGV